MNNNEFNNNVYPSSNQNMGNGYTQQPTQPVQQSQMNIGYTQQHVQNLNNNYTNITPEKKDNKNVKKILLIVIALLIIAGVAFTGYKYFFKDKEKNGDFDITASTSFFL